MRQATVGPRTVDLVLRIPVSAGSLAEIIGAHDLVAKQLGAVWIGIFKGLSTEFIEKLARKSNEERGSYLYVIQYGKETFTGFRAEIIRLQSRLPRSEYRLIPGYYEETGITGSVGAWVKVRNIERVSGERLRRLRIASTNSAVLTAMQHSMLTVALVYEAAA